MALLDAPTTDSLLATVTARAGDPGLVHLERLPARDAVHAQPGRPLHPAVAARLREAGVEELWAHQARAIDLVRDGRSTVIATGTASGPGTTVFNAENPSGSTPVNSAPSRNSSRRSASACTSGSSGMRGA